MLVDRKQFLGAVRILQKACDPKAPSLHDAVFSSDERGFELSATDGTTWVNISVPTLPEIDDVPLQVSCEPKPVAAFLASSKNDQIHVFGGEGMELRADDSGAATFSSTVNERGRMRMPLQSSSGAWTFTSSEFCRTLSYVRPAIGTPETLSRVLFTEGRAIAVDGHRMHVADCQPKMCDADACPKELLVPRATSEVIRAACKLVGGNIHLRCAQNGGGNATVLHGDGISAFVTWKAFTSLPFPPYKQVIPDPEHQVTVQAGQLLEAVKTFRKLLTKSTLLTRALVIQRGMGNELLLAMSEAPFSRIITCQLGEFPDDVAVGLCTQYLIDALSAFRKNEPVVFGFSDTLSPCTVTDVASTVMAVIMPIRISAQRAARMRLATATATAK